MCLSCSTTAERFSQLFNSLPPAWQPPQSAPITAAAARKGEMKAEGCSSHGSPRALCWLPADGVGAASWALVPRVPRMPGLFWWSDIIHKVQALILRVLLSDAMVSEAAGNSSCLQSLVDCWCLPRDVALGCRRPWDVQRCMHSTCSWHMGGWDSRLYSG